MASTSQEASKSETPEGTEVEQSQSIASESTKVTTTHQSKADVEQTVIPKEAPTETDGQGGPSSPPEDLSAADDLMERGSKAFDGRNFVEASDCFRRALAIRVKHYGESAPQCTHAYISYGLSLMHEVPIPIGDDPTAVVPKEAGYHDGDGSISAAKHDGDQIHSDGNPDGVNWGDSSKNLKSAWNQLSIARSILKKQLGESQEKACILDALGKLAFREGGSNSKNYFLDTILESMVESNFQLQHIPNLFFKICVCLESYSKTEAIAYCEKGISLCQTRLKHLMDELKSSSTPAATSTASELNQESSGVPPVDPTILQKQAEINTLTELSSNFGSKLEDMQKPLISTPTPNSSGNPERTSTDATATTTNPERTSTDAFATPASLENLERTTTDANSGNLERTSTKATSSVKCSQQMSATNYCGASEFDSSTACTNVTGRVMGGNGAKRQSSTDHASPKSTAMKKPHQTQQ